MTILSKTKYLGETMIKITSVQDAVKDTGLKCVVHGLSGAGKTRLCATTGESTLILNVEGGLLSIVDAPSYIKTAKIENLEQFDEVYQFLKEQRTSGNQEFSWVAIDSISDVAETVLKNEMEKSNDPRKSYPAFQAEMIRLIKAFRDLEGYNVIMTAKQGLVKDEYTGITLRVPSMPGNKLGPAIPYLFDNVFALRVEKDEDGEDYRVIQTSRDILYEAKDRSGKLNMYEKPDLQHIFNKTHGTTPAVIVERSDEPPQEEKVETQPDKEFYWLDRASMEYGICFSKEQIEEKIKAEDGLVVEISKEQYIDIDDDI